MFFRPPRSLPDEPAPLVRVLRTARYGFSEPSGIAISGHDAFVTNVTANTVTEFNTTTGALVRVLS
jgi:hypothetical protein